jgi:hypothetical protein
MAWLRAHKKCIMALKKRNIGQQLNAILLLGEAEHD